MEIYDCEIRFFGDGETGERRIVVGASEEYVEKHDSEIFFECESEDDFILLLDPNNGEDFLVTKIINQETIKEMEEVKEPFKKESAQQTKRCSRCGRELPLSAFNLSAKAPDGHQYVCKECMNLLNKESRAKKKGLKRVWSNPALSGFTPRQLIDELRSRGYQGELRVIQKVIV